MTPGDIALIRLPSTAGAAAKLRPALVLSLLPGAYQNVLLCGISTRLNQLEKDWDELISSGDADFPASKLRSTSSIRLSYLHATDVGDIVGTIGRIDSSRLKRILERLARHLAP
jgi:mRNA-degrading endonuclease toxin of MazEF toxin-antitoxin module